MDQPADIDQIITRIREDAARAAQGQASSERIPIQARHIPLIPPPPSAALPEAQRYSIGQFYNLPHEDLLERAYVAVLGRQPDANGRATYLPALLSGAMTPAQRLWNLSSSEEGRKRGVVIDRLERALQMDRLTQRRALRRPLSWLVSILRLPRILRGMKQQMTGQNEEIRQLIQSANGIFSEIRTALDEVRAMARLADRDALGAQDISRGAVESLSAMSGQMLEQSGRLRALIEQAKQALPAGATAPVLAELDAHRFDDLYLAMQLIFRGSSDDVTAKSERYLPLLLNNEWLARGETFLDIGCGRGEWLALLRSKTIACRGIAHSEAMVAEAKARGFDVVAADAVAYLKGQPDASLGGISAFHVVEHIPFFDLVDLLDELRRVLKPGGVLLFETPNPENLVVGACKFNYDPTPQKPLPPELLNFVVTVRGLPSRVIRRPEDCAIDAGPSEFNPQDLNDWFRLPMDYAIFATKPTTAGAA